MPQQDGRSHQAHVVKSINDAPIDPSIAAPNPTYPYEQHSPYAPNPDMAPSYPHPSGGMYAAYPQAANAAQPQQKSAQIYSFVPMLGAQQHKRPRRRYEDIERMYKCGWNGCEKAYGTLNHLNAHVTKQLHGQKRTPEEFKEIRKEWKQRKKDEEARRKADEELQRQAATAQAAQNGGPDQGPDGRQAAGCPSSLNVQFPPIGYQPTQYPAPPSATVSQQPMSDYGGSHMYPNYQPHYYGQPIQSLYSQTMGG
ncbi:hypothetical protein S40293_09546 [Stachybotrys chartarum IBT 40293]|nr:hypothetical protein S40293_09546 [Stachybotrys chartarum IBT 40293]